MTRMPGGIRLPRARAPVLPAFRRSARITIAASAAFSLCRDAIGLAGLTLGCLIRTAATTAATTTATAPPHGAG
ncbi:hypothetical protein [Streptomyces sp. 8N616]|uniref:hypothetical protein n=1 Tax=Streptomyces sp. 8N616 TaxID=3457414 RepID=UPI003FD536A7